MIRYPRYADARASSALLRHDCICHPDCDTPQDDAIPSNAGFPDGILQPRDRLFGSVEFMDARSGVGIVMALVCLSGAAVSISLCSAGSR